MQKAEPVTRREQYAETVKQSIQEEIVKAKNSKEKGERFLEWVITRLFDASPDEIRNQIIDGPNDMGIDLWIKPGIESENGGIIQLFQFKYNESHDEKEILGFIDDVKKFLKMDLEDIPRKELKELYQMIKKENLETELYYITDRKIDFKTRSRKLKVYGFDQIVDKLWDDIIGIPKGKQETIHLEEMLPYKDSIIGVVSLAELRKFIENSQSSSFFIMYSKRILK